MPFSKTNTAKGKAAGALAKPVQPDEVLAAVVGPGPLPRTEITKKVWEYIRQHHLQDPKTGSTPATRAPCRSHSATDDPGSASRTWTAGALSRSRWKRAAA